MQEIIDCIKFSNATENVQKCKYTIVKTDFWDNSLSRSFQWFKRFKDGQQTTEDDPYPSVQVKNYSWYHGNFELPLTTFLLFCRKFGFHPSPSSAGTEYTYNNSCSGYGDTVFLDYFISEQHRYETVPHGCVLFELPRSVRFDVWKRSDYIYDVNESEYYVIDQRLLTFRQNRYCRESVCIITCLSYLLIL